MNINISEIESVKNSFSTAKANFNANSYSAFQSSSLKNTQIPALAILSNKINQIYEKIQSSYTSIDDWLNAYTSNVKSYENTIANKSVDFNLSEDTLSSYANNNLNEFNTFDKEFTKMTAEEEVKQEDKKWYEKIWDKMTAYQEDLNKAEQFQTQVNLTATAAVVEGFVNVFEGGVDTLINVGNEMAKAQLEENNNSVKYNVLLPEEVRNNAFSEEYIEKIEEEMDNGTAAIISYDVSSSIYNKATANIDEQIANGHIRTVGNTIGGAAAYMTVNALNPFGVAGGAVIDYAVTSGTALEQGINNGLTYDEAQELAAIEGGIAAASGTLPYLCGGLAA